MDILETIARSLAEELKSPAGTTIAYTGLIAAYEADHCVMMRTNRESSRNLAFIAMKQCSVWVISAHRFEHLNYNNPELLDRLQKILDEVAEEDAEACKP